MRHLWIKWSVLFFALSLLVSCGGGGSSSNNNGTDSNGTHSSVSNVTSFVATAGDTWASLSWANPNSNFSGVMVRRGTTCPGSPSSGTLVSDTTDTTVLDSTLANGTTYCYVAFVYDGSGNYSSGATAYATPRASYVAVSAGGIHTLAIKSDGTLWAWGSDSEGQLGNGCTFGSNCYDRLSPGQVGSDNKWSSASAGTAHSVAIKQNGTLWSWGDNGDGEIGTGCNPTINGCYYYSTPTQITTDTNWASISAGGFFTVSIKTDGTLWAWGSNYGGQLGDGCTPMSSCANKTTPAQIGTDTHWSAAAAGGNHVIALKTDGTLWAWGINDYGQLGNGAPGPAAYSSVPVQIGTATDWKKIAAGDMHSLAIKTDGTLWAWGDNSYGQLGTCSGCLSAGVPTQVGTDTNWKDVDGGFALTIALKTGGSVWTWGNFSTSTGASSSVPLQVGTGTAWSKVSAGGGGGTSGIGGGHFMALQSMSPSGYMLMSWGTNMYGQLGIGTASPVWVPTRVY